METVKINENINLHYIPMTKLKTTSIGIYIGTNLKKEEVSLSALLPYVLMKATKKAENASEMAKYLQNLYGAKLYTGVSKRGDNRFINFEGEVISDRYAPGGEKLLKGLIDLMLSVVFEPIAENGAFKADIIEREKKNSINRIKGIINDKTRYADKKCIEEMFKGEEYSVSEYGYIDDIEKITPKSLFEYYKKMITESAINIFLCGELNIAEVEKEVRAAVSDMSFKKAELAENKIIKNDKECREIKEQTELTQGKLSIGFRTNVCADSPEIWALIVANNIYGGGMGAKLFNNVREKLSLAYYVSTSIDRSKGFMLLHAGIAFDKFDEAKKEIFVQLNEMKNGNITDDEMSNAKSEIVNALNSCYDDQKQLQSYYMGNIISGTDVSLEEYKENIKKVTKQEVIDVINKLETDTIYFLEK